MASIDHSQALLWFNASEDMSMEARRIAEQGRDYYDNNQYTEAELKKYKSRNQPPVTNNRIKPKVDFLLGMERQTRTDPKAFPRNAPDIEGAQAATDSIRYICDNNNFDQERSLVFENMLIEGTGGVELSVVPAKKGDFEILVEHIPWDRIFYDPHSRRADFRDAKYFGFVMWMDFDDAKGEFEGKEALLESVMASTAQSDTFDDAPRNRWSDSKRKRVRIARIWYFSDGNWHHATFTGAGYLEEPQISPFKDEMGDTEPGMMLQSSFVTREGERYGVTWPLLSIQDAINYRESKALHTSNVRQTWGTKEAGIDTRAVKKQLAKADGHIELPAGRKFGEDFGIIPTNDISQANLLLLQESKSSIDNIGAAAALSGKGGASSGRELIARQQGGKMELGPVFDNLRQWQHRVYNWMWMRVKQFWTEPKMVRITDDPKNAKFVGLNQEVTVRDQVEARLQTLDPPQEIPAFLQNDPRLDVVIGTKNNTAEIDVDIVVDDAPDTTTLVGEQFAELMAYAAANPGAIPPKVILKASQLANKDELLEEMEKAEESQAQARQKQQEVVEATIKLEVKNAISEIKNKDADTAVKVATVDKVQSETVENMSQARENIAQAVSDELDNALQVSPAIQTGVVLQPQI